MAGGEVFIESRAREMIGQMERFGMGMRLALRQRPRGRILLSTPVAHESICPGLSILSHCTILYTPAATLCPCLIAWIFCFRPLGF